MSKLSVVLTSDTSGSMSGDKIKNSKQAQKDFIDQLPGEAEVGLVSFGGQVNVTRDLTNNFSGLKRALDKTSANGGTPMLGGLRVSYELLNGEETDWEIKDLFNPSRSAKIKPPRGKENQAIVLSSDGKAASNASKIKKFGNQIKDQGVKMITIAIGSSAAKGLLRDLASSDEDFHEAEFSGELPDLYEQVATGLIVAEGG